MRPAFPALDLATLCLQAPVSCRSRLAMRILRFCYLIHRFTPRQQSSIFPYVTLIWRDVADAAVAVFFVVPAHKEKLIELDTLKIHFHGCEEKVLKKTLKHIESNKESVIDAYIKRHRLNPNSTIVVLKLKNNLIR